MFQTIPKQNETGIKNLKNHSINCSADSVITQLKYNINNSNGFHNYKYNCKNIANTSDLTIINQETQLDDIGNEIIYLDRHNIECPTNYGLNSIQLENNNNKIKYKYKCIKTNDTQVINYHTELNDKGNGIEYLDRHNITCPPNSHLKQFKLEHDNFSKIRYNYQCSSNNNFTIINLQDNLFQLTSEQKADLNTNIIYKYGCFRKKNGSQLLVVYFGPAGGKLMDGINVAIKFDCNLLFFTDITQNWYSENSEDIIRYITKIVSDNNIKKIIMWGYSMGGYAAIKFSTYFNCICIAFAPQTFNK